MGLFAGIKGFYVRIAAIYATLTVANRHFVFFRLGTTGSIMTIAAILLAAGPGERFSRQENATHKIDGARHD
jgi:hypothetical protein